MTNFYSNIRLVFNTRYCYSKNIKYSPTMNTFPVSKMSSSRIMEMMGQKWCDFRDDKTRASCRRGSDLQEGMGPGGSGPPASLPKRVQVWVQMEPVTAGVYMHFKQGWLLHTICSNFLFHQPKYVGADLCKNLFLIHNNFRRCVGIFCRNPRKRTHSPTL